MATVPPSSSAAVDGGHLDTNDGSPNHTESSAPAWHEWYTRGTCVGDPLPTHGGSEPWIHGSMKDKHETNHGMAMIGARSRLVRGSTGTTFRIDRDHFPDRPAPLSGSTGVTFRIEGNPTSQPRMTMVGAPAALRSQCPDSRLIAPQECTFFLHTPFSRSRRQTLHV